MKRYYETRVQELKDDVLTAVARLAWEDRLEGRELLDVPEQTVELADSLGATTPQLVTRFLYPEARSGLVLPLYRAHRQSLPVLLLLFTVTVSLSAPQTAR